MKSVRYFKWFLMICLVVLPFATNSEVKAEGNPEFAVPETQYTFQPVLEGTEVAHDFVILNKGADALSVLNVKTG